MTLRPLDRAMRSVLAQLELISSGTTQSYNSSGGGSGGGGNPEGTPAGAAGAEHLHWARQYGPPFAPAATYSATDDQARAAVIEAARDELKQLRGHDIDRSRVVGETQKDEDARILKIGEGFPSSEVALRFKITPTRVRRLRLADGRDAEHGRKPTRPAAELAAEQDGAEEAARMKANGMSERQIAFSLQQHRTTVTRWLKRVA